MSFTNIRYAGLPLKVEFDYSPYEPRTQDHPGYDEVVEITDVLIEGTEYSLLELLSDEYLEDIEEKVWEQLAKDRQDSIDYSEYCRERE